MTELSFLSEHSDNWSRDVIKKKKKKKKKKNQVKLKKKVISLEQKKRV